MEISLIPETIVLTTTILPAIYRKGIQSKAESSEVSPRKEHVILALSIIRDFSTLIDFGFPVDPLVFTITVDNALFHSL